MSEQAGRYQRSPAGMVGALLVLLALIGGFVLLGSLTRDSPPSPVQPVAYAQSAEYARGQADFALLAPARLPAGWRATSVTFTGGAGQHWHLGVLTDQNRYIGLEQGKVTVRSMVRQYVDPQPVRGEPVSIDGHTWTAWSDSGGDHALARRSGRATTLVVGPVPQALLVDYIRSLR